jgi:hypothetical protein
MKRSLPTRVRAACLAASVLLAAAPALSADYCLTLVGLGNVYVGKKFKLPKKGKCADWSGFCMTLCSANVQSGTACTSSDGLQTHFQITTAYLGSPSRESASIDLQVQTQTGSADVLAHGTGASASYDSEVTGAKCSVPVP